MSSGKCRLCALVAEDLQRRVFLEDGHDGGSFCRRLVAVVAVVAVVGLLVGYCSYRSTVAGNGLCDRLYIWPFK